MRKTGYITFSAVMAALAAVVMLTSYFPYLTYSVPALAGMFCMIAVLELGNKWGLAVYIASSFIALLSAEPEAAFMYVCLFGLYPILKTVFEKIRLTPFRIIVKLAYFNAGIALVYLVFMRIAGISIGMDGVKAYAVGGLVVLANVVFLIYDFALLRISQWYFLRLHGRISRMIKK